MRELGLGWEGNSVTTHGKAFVSVLVDTFWYLSDRSHAMEGRGCGVPEMFSRFAGYNKPESYKGKKLGSLNRTILEVHACNIQYHHFLPAAGFKQILGNKFD